MGSEPLHIFDPRRFWEMWAPYLSYIEDNHLDLANIEKLGGVISDPVLIVGAGQGLLLRFSSTVFTIQLNVRTHLRGKRRKMLRSQCWRHRNRIAVHRGGWGVTDANGPAEAALPRNRQGTSRAKYTSRTEG
jgi:hypothetical protein